MISVLLVEDSQAKIAVIAETMNSCGASVDLIIAMNVVHAKKELKKRRFDLLILDINLPPRAESEPEFDGGLEVLRWLKTRGRPHRPQYIIGMTAVEESYQRAKSEFDNLIWRLIPIRLDECSWRSQLLETIRAIASQLRAPFASDGATHHTDVLVVAALDDPELSAIIALDGGFERIAVAHDMSDYYRGRFIADRRFIDVVSVASSDKGLAGAAIAATKGIHSFWPHYVYMPGITAGLKGRTNIGDVLFADPAWDWGSGKIKMFRGEERFHPAPYQRRLDETLSRAAAELSRDRSFLSNVYDSWPHDKPPSPPRILIGPMASGASVLQSSRAVQRVLDQHKDVIGIEMEAFSVMFSCNAAALPRPLPVVAKAVCDNGDGKKMIVFRSMRHIRLHVCLKNSRFDICPEMLSNLYEVQFVISGYTLP